MAKFALETFIAAPPEVCFDLSLDLDLHQGSMDHTGEKIVGGRPAGRIGLHEFVTWEGRHFGIRQRMTVGITAMERPFRFQDQMLKGAFKRFVHEHVFEVAEGGTLMRDTFDLCAPLAPLSWPVDRWVLIPYMRALMVKRNTLIKQMAESRQLKSTGPGSL